MSLAHPKTVDDLLNYRLSCLLAASGAMVTRLCEGRYGITRREWRLIALIAAHGPMSPSELAARGQLELARVSRHVTDLVDKGLMQRTRLEQDRRRAVVQLTPKGERVFADLFPESTAFNNQVLAALTPKELRAFDIALAKLTETATRVAGEKPVLEKADRRHGGARRIRRE